WSALRDSVSSLRLLAAKTLLARPEPGADRVRRVIDTLGGGDIDAGIQAAKSLLTLGVAEQLVQATLAVLEGERPSTCPECKIELASRDRFAHLVTRHGYLDVDGVLLPRPAALGRLWERVLTGSDTLAHARLLQVYGESTVANAYVAA